MREYLPPMVIWENVLGMTRQRVMPYFDYLLQAMRWPTTVPRPGDEWWHHAVRLDQRVRGPLNTRYRVGWQLVDAADFGVPQRRRRLIVVAIRADLLDDDDIPDLEPTHSRTQLHYAQWVSQAYWAEHGIDPPPDTPEEWHEARLLKLKKVAEKERDETELVRWLTVRDALHGLPQPVDGEEHPTILNHVGIPNARAYPGHTGSPIDKPAKTVKAGVHGVCGGEAMTRYPDDTLRYWTVREAARIQTFPDEYAFPVPRSRAMAQIGNAVPVRLAEAVGHHLRGLAGI
jgi:DNA (cytosine-5)-methyltransferase 1